MYWNQNTLKKKKTIIIYQLFTLRISWKVVSSTKEKKLLAMKSRQDSSIEETATWTGSVHLTSGVQEDSLSQWFRTSMADEMTWKKDGQIQ